MRSCVVSFVLLAVPILAACQPRDIPTDAPKTSSTSKMRVPLPISASEKLICKSISEASAGGKASLQLAIIDTQEGRAFARDKMDAMLRAAPVRFTSSEMNKGHCWVYGEPSVSSVGAANSIAWRCPVTVVRDNPNHAGSSILEEVDSSNCEFGIVKGVDVKRFVSSTVERLQF